MAHGNNLINIPGELHSVATEGVVASADAIKDYTKGKTQEKVNQEVDADLSDIKSKQANLQTAIDNEKTRAEGVEATKANADNVYTKAQGTAFENQVNSAISEQDQLIDERLDAQDDKIEALEKQEVVVVDDHEAVENPNPTTIYREVSEDGSTYTDWMYQGEWKKLATYGFPGIDDEPIPDSDRLAKSGGIASMYGSYENNPEWVCVKCDEEGKVLYGVKKDGNFYFGTGCPQQIKDYIQAKINELPIEELEDIVVFLDNLEKEDKTLRELLDNKLDAVPTENPKYLQVTTDFDSKILQSIKSDGTSCIGGDLEVKGQASIKGDATVRGNVDLANESIQSVDNPEYLKVTTDYQGKVLNGIKKDGSHYIYNVQSESIDALNVSKVDKEEGKSLVPNELIGTVFIEDNPEYIDVKVDLEDKILEGITTDGIKKINIPVDNGAAIIETTDNPEFIEAKVDAEGKLIEGINKNGEKIFGVIPPQIKQYINENMPVGGSGVQNIEYDDATGDMYATYDNESGVSDVYMEPDGDIYVEYDE